MTVITKSEIRTNRLRWLEALESGDYVQGNGALHGPLMIPAAARTEFCCLGVACDLRGKGYWARDGRYVVEGESVYGDGLIDCADSPLLGLPLREIGLSEQSRMDCIKWNDESSCDFQQIARKMRGRWRLPKSSAEIMWLPSGNPGLTAFRKLTSDS